ncbi:hypothetical protein AFLA_001556 [Aspergillus flavus NRRL3357]|nr:hypothetical protein AFLA_001556 [Aspergillus flavus NRRL3357]
MAQLPIIEFADQPIPRPLSALTIHPFPSIPLSKLPRDPRTMPNLSQSQQQITSVSAERLDILAIIPPRDNEKPPSRIKQASK